MPTVESTVSEFEKSQTVRLADIFFIAPYLIYLGYKGKVTPADKVVLIGLGIATLLYNGNNYLKNLKREN